MGSIASATDGPRWSRGGYARVYNWGQCRYCGSAHGNGAQGRACEAVACMLCGTVQCHGNGLGNGRCALCHAGFLPGWSGNHGKACDYARCEEPAVAIVRKRRACKGHAERSLGDQIAARIAVRDAGGGWERWQYVT